MNKYVGLVAIAALIGACGQKEHTAPTAADAPPPTGDSPSVATTTEPETTATAEATAGAAVKLSPTQGNTANGALKITAAGAGVKISGMLQGLTLTVSSDFIFMRRAIAARPMGPVPALTSIPPARITVTHKPSRIMRATC